MTGTDILSGIVKLTRSGFAWIERSFAGRVHGGRGWKTLPKSIRRTVLRFTQSRHPERHEVIRHLHEFTERFTESYAGTDREFVEMGRALRELYRIGQTLARLVNDRLAAMRDALTESHISGVDGIAARALCDLRAGLKEASEQLHSLRSVATDLRRLRVQVERLQRVGMFVRVAGLGFAVESARTAGCQEIFGSFVTELRALAEKIATVAQTIAARLLHAQQAQEGECKAMSADHAELSKLAEELATTAGATAAGAQALFDHALKSLSRADDHTRQMIHHSGEAVFYLQFGDIVRQKTEHIAAALEEGVARLAETVSEREFCLQADAMDRILAIQAGQLELIRSEVKAAQMKLGKSFQCLGGETCGLKDVLHRWQGRSALDPDAEDALDIFRADLQRLESLKRRGQELQRSALRTAQSAAEASGRLGRSPRGSEGHQS